MTPLAVVTAEDSGDDSDGEGEEGEGGRTQEDDDDDEEHSQAVSPVRVATCRLPRAFLTVVT